MTYAKSEAKDHARAHLRGIWAAAVMPFSEELSMNEMGLRRNLRHWVDDLGIDGVFIAGKQSEFFSMSVAERKRAFEITVDEVGRRAGVIASCSDQNMDVVIELAKHAQAVGADYIVVHAPVLHFLHQQDETLYQYYKTISERIDIGIAMWSHPDSGYLMSPELCARIAELPNIVAIKYSVPREMCDTRDLFALRSPGSVSPLCLTCAPVKANGAARKARERDKRACEIRSAPGDRQGVGGASPPR